MSHCISGIFHLVIYYLCTGRSCASYHDGPVFDLFLQIVSPENWNSVLLDVYRFSGWAGFLLILSVFILGNYVLRSLFVGVMLGNFSAPDLEGIFIKLFALHGNHHYKLIVLWFESSPGATSSTAPTDQSVAVADDTGFFNKFLNLCYSSKIYPSYQIGTDKLPIQSYSCLVLQTNLPCTLVHGIFPPFIFFCVESYSFHSRYQSTTFYRVA